MLNIYKKNGNTISIPMSIGIGVLISLIVTGIGGILGSSMIHNGSMDESAYGAVTFLIWILAAFAGSISSGLCYKNKFNIVSLITTIVYVFLMLSGGILVFEGNLNRIGQGVLAILIGYAATFILNKAKFGHKKSKVHYRRR